MGYLRYMYRRCNLEKGWEKGKLSHNQIGQFIIQPGAYANVSFFITFLFYENNVLYAFFPFFFFKKELIVKLLLHFLI